MPVRQFVYVFYVRLRYRRQRFPYTPDGHPPRSSQARPGFALLSATIDPQFAGVLLHPDETHDVGVLWASPSHVPDELKAVRIPRLSAHTGILRTRSGSLPPRSWNAEETSRLGSATRWALAYRLDEDEGAWQIVTASKTCKPYMTGCRFLNPAR